MFHLTHKLPAWKQATATKVFLALLVLGILTFANGLKNPMMIDDHAFFDEKMRNLKFLWIQFVPDKDVVFHLKDQQTDAYYRPLAHVLPSRTPRCSQERTRVDGALV